MCVMACMATYTCVGATMCHIQHMLPSSSPKLWHTAGLFPDMIRGDNMVLGPRGQRAQPGASRSAQDLFASSLSMSVWLCGHGGGLRHTHRHMQSYILCLTCMHTM